MRSASYKYSSGRQKQKDIQKKQSKNSSRSGCKSRRLSSAGCTPPPPLLHTSSFHGDVAAHIEQRNETSDADQDPVRTCDYHHSGSNVDQENQHTGRDFNAHHRHHQPSQFGNTVRRNVSPRNQTSYYPFRVMGGLGIAQIFLGLLAASMQLVAVFVHEPTSFIGAGIWSGLFFILAGSLAVVSTRRKGQALVSYSIAVMVVSIFAILVALGMLAVASIGLHLTSNFQYNTEYPLSWKVLESLLVVIALVEGLVAFLTSVMACKGIALNCRVPQQIGVGAESTALYMLVQNNGADATHTIDLPQSLEVRPLVSCEGIRIGAGFCEALEEHMVDRPPESLQKGTFRLSRPTSIHYHGNITLNNDDFEPPPAYSERI